jgi:hypothetical protein
MALDSTDWGCPDGWLGCHRLGRQKEEEEEPRLRETDVYRSDRRSCDWGPE